MEEKSLTRFIGLFIVLSLAVPALSPLLLAGGLVVLTIKARMLGGMAADWLFPTKTKKEKENEKETEPKVKKDQSVRKEKQQAPERPELFSKKNGWNALAFPLDMEPMLGSAMASSIKVDAAGIPGVVTAERKRKGVDLSFTLDRAKAVNVQNLIREKGLDAFIEPSLSGGFVVHSGNIDIINQLARHAFIGAGDKEQKAELTVSEHREYVISGCSSYEEALEKFRATRSTLVPDNTYMTKECKMGDKSDTKMSGEPMKASLVELPIGTYIISEENAYMSSGMVQVPIGMSDEKDILSFAADKLSAMPMQKGDAPVVSDATPNVVHTLNIGDDSKLTLRKAYECEQNLKDVKAFMEFGDLESALKVLVPDALPAGTQLCVARKPPTESPWVIELPIGNTGTMSKLVHGRTEEMAEEVGRFGYSRADVTGSLIFNDIERFDIATVYTSGSLPLTKALVNGVPIEEMADRLKNTRLPYFEDEAMRQSWCKDAASMKSFSVTLDPKTNLLTITAQVDGEVVTTTFPLGKKEREALNARGPVNKAEWKDLLMQMRPDKFATYRVTGVKEGTYLSPFASPVQDFVYNRRPEVKKAKEKINKVIKKLNL